MIRRSKNRQGFTLIELIVVLMILVGLAGMVIPAVTDMVARTHTAAGSGNIAEAANAIARYEAQYLSYPNGFDSLKVDMTAAASDFTSLSDEINPAAGSTLVDETDLTQPMVDALAAAGITALREHVLANDATFGATTSQNIALGDDLLTLTAAGAGSLGLSPAVDDRYLLLGIGANATMIVRPIIGANATMIGRTMTEAPVHFPETGSENPAIVYNRFIAVFDIAGERAKLVKIMSPHGDALDGHMQEYFEIVNDNQ